MTRRPTPRAAQWPSARSIALSLVALVAAAALWWRTTGDPLEAAGARRLVSTAAGPVPPAARPDSASSAAPARVAPLPPPPVTPYPATGTPGIATDDPLTAYKKANVYPPTSRPLTKDQLDLLEPNRRHESTREADQGDGITYLFTADRYFVIADETLTATLEVRRDGRPIAVTLTQSVYAVLDPVTHRELPIPLSFAARSGVLAATIAPAKLGLARQSAIGVYVEFDYGDGKQRAHFNFQYTPAAGIPARFAGAFHDEIESGSLVIHAAIDVITPGPYLIDANLFDAADQPVAWTRFKGDLAAGRQIADLIFFGKVLVDASARGPFHLGQLRGARFAPGRDPDLEQMPPFTGSFTTKPYATSDFSDAEYDSAEKQRMIELLGNDRNHRGAAAGRAP
jgi:hypothetical protein